MSDPNPDGAAADAPVSTVDVALKDFRELMAGDGYRLSWAESAPDKVVVTIEAGPDACADCLVPLPVMESIMADALEPTPYALDHVVLPGGH